MVFREIGISVAVDHDVVFRFAIPLSLIELVVAARDESIPWEFIASEFQPVPVQGGTFQSWPIDQAPPEMLAMVKHIQEREDRRLEVEGPRKPPLSEVVYGKVPPGYREKASAKQPLPSGEYNVIVFAEQGQGSARFVVP